MTRRPLRNVGASVRARLLERSRDTGEGFQFLLQRYAAERFLHRLGESPCRERFVLKGAMLLALWSEAIYRPTRDLDLTGYGSASPDDVRSAIRDICTVPVADDGIVFNCEALTLEPIRGQEEYDGIRTRFDAMLDGARISMRIDIGFGNAIQPPPIDAHYPTLLDAPRPRIRVYPRETVVAEKLHAMVILDERNSRYKDFYDVHALVRHFAFESEHLVRAVVATFERRRTTISRSLPVALTPRFYADADRAERWRNYVNGNELPGAPLDFGVIGERLLLFFTEPWAAMAQSSRFAGHWSSGGPWRSRVRPIDESHADSRCTG